ncbi:MAG: metal-dependent phosphohydrolase [Cyanobacteria bacterium J06638_6]
MKTNESTLAGLSDRYQAMFKHYTPRYDRTFAQIATPVLAHIAASDAPYHNIEHTLQAMTVGQAMLEGKQYYEGSVSPCDWLNLMVSLLCHDVGYVKGVCEGDRPHHHHYEDGQGAYVHLAPHGTGAALEQCHVARSQVYVATYLSQYAELDLAIVQWNIEMTRFPVPNEARYDDTLSYGGLCRAADLLGQLSDPQYLHKLPALFQEFEETGINQTLGFRTPADLRFHYPHVYWHGVYPYIQPSMRYLAVTPAGRKCIAQLYTNVHLAESTRPSSQAISPRLALERQAS